MDTRKEFEHSKPYTTPEQDFFFADDYEESSELDSTESEHSSETDPGYEVLPSSAELFSDDETNCSDSCATDEDCTTESESSSSDDEIDEQLYQLRANEEVNDSIRTSSKELFSKAEKSLDDGQIEDAIIKYHAAINTLLRLPTFSLPDYRELDTYYNSLSIAYTRLGKIQQALNATFLAFNMLQVIEKLHGMQDEDTYWQACYSRDIGNFYYQLYENEKSNSYLEKAIDILNNKQRSAPLNNEEKILLASCLIKQQKYAAAISLFNSIQNKTDSEHRAIARYQHEIAEIINAMEPGNELSSAWLNVICAN